MSELKIRRRLRTTIDVTVGTVVSESTTLRFDDVAGGVLFVSDLHTAVISFAVYGATDDAAYRGLYGPDGQAASITIGRLSGTAVATVGTATAQITVYTSQPGAYALPEAAYAVPYIRFVSNAAVGESATVSVVTKS